jgi:putative peptidoglycan lipid II flippase
LSGWAAQTVISRGFYALGSTWVPTLVGTVVAFLSVPLYVALRLRWGAAGLAIASSTAMLVYVLLLGFLQRRRFEREAAAEGSGLCSIDGILRPALRLAAAAAVAIVAGLGLRALLLQWLPLTYLPALLLRATLLSAVGLSIYLALARLFGIRELDALQQMLLGRLGIRRWAARE